MRRLLRVTSWGRVSPHLVPSAALSVRTTRGRPCTNKDTERGKKSLSLLLVFILKQCPV